MGRHEASEAQAREQDTHELYSAGVAEDSNRKCRKSMEDAYTVEKNICGEQSGYFAVFDGHAGRGVAEWCSKHLQGLLSHNISTCASVPQALSKSFEQADEQLKLLSIHNSGCTAAVALLRREDKNQNKLYVANVGDTRVILCRGGQALRLTYDHRGSDPHESQRIASKGGIMLNNRVSGVLAVTRSLGDSYLKELVTGAPYTTETELCDDDEFFVIACDGIWDVCDDQTAVRLIRNVQDPARASQMLVDHALDCSSLDNLTCMVVRLS